MSPLSTISSTLPVYDITSQTRAVSPEISQLGTPEVQMPLGGTAGTGATQRVGESSFANVLGRMVQDVSSQQNIAAQTVSALQSGQNVSLHQAVIAMEEANVSFQLMVEVRNKLLKMDQEVMRMQV